MKKQPSFEKTKWWCKRERGKIFGFSSLHAWLEKGKKWKKTQQLFSLFVLLFLSICSCSINKKGKSIKI